MFIKKTVKDVLGWLSSIQRVDKDDEEELLLFHYMDDIRGCGVMIEKRLQESFFIILETLAQLLNWCNEQNL